jgi:L-histidine Nalpha-methyltransferase
MSRFDAVRPVMQPPSRTSEGLQERLRLRSLSSPQSQEMPGADVVQGLSQTPKTLPAWYFYDDRGSGLFEQICTLPEYYPTRTETAILQTYAPAIAQITGPCELVELGSGSSTKTRLLLDAYQTCNYPLRYLPIDVSGGMLKTSALDLLSVYPTLEVYGLVGTYELALAYLPPSPLPARMLVFLGSTLGNLSPEACDQFLEQVTAALQPGEYFLLGVDLQKDPAQLEAAYNDSQEVTAAFNRNILHHLNWRFQGNFNPEQFQHWAFYNETDHQIEMHLKSPEAQQVLLQALDLEVFFTPGETIRTEISRKFNLTQIQEVLQTKGLEPIQHWSDPQGWFGLVLTQLR